MRRGHILTNRNGFSLIELLVVIGIISILIGMLMPAVQAVRESARSVSCKNHLRQWGIAAGNFESAMGHLPGSWFNAPVDSPAYSQDRGLFVQLLPMIERNSEYDQLSTASTTFDPANQTVLVHSIELLRCPSSIAEPAELQEIASVYSGPAVAGLRANTCDYIGNGGYVSDVPIDPALTDGPIGVQIPGTGIPKETMARVVDGQSHTLLFWESIGSVIMPAGGGLTELDVDANAAPSMSLFVYGPPPMMLNSVGVASTKSYRHAWAGCRIGNIHAVGSQVVNVGNSSGEPCSRHPAGAHAVMVDGSIRTLTESLAVDLANGMASARGREVPAGLD